MDNMGIKKPIYHFGDRITNLMQLDGIDLNSKKPGPDRILLDKLISMGIIKLNTEKWDTEKETIKEYENRRKYDLTKVISKQREKASATEISTEWINNYCKVFNCDSDYLFGYTDTPSREITDISKATGLSENSVKLFTDFKKRIECIEKWKQDIPIRSSFTSEEDFDQAIEDYKRTFMEINKKYAHVPGGLILGTEALLRSCYLDDSKNIFDLICSYLFNKSWETIDLMYSLERNGQLIESEHKGRIIPPEYDHTYMIINNDVSNRQKISELIEEAQLRNINNKLSQIRESYQREEK